MYCNTLLLPPAVVGSLAGCISTSYSPLLLRSGHLSALLTPSNTQARESVSGVLASKPAFVKARAACTAYLIVRYSCCGVVITLLAIRQVSPLIAYQCGRMGDR